MFLPLVHKYNPALVKKPVFSELILAFKERRLA